MATDRLLRMKELQEVVGLKKSSLYNLMSEGKFPRPVKLGLRAVAWKQSDVEKWINKLKKEAQ